MLIRSVTVGEIIQWKSASYEARNTLLCNTVLMFTLQTWVKSTSSNTEVTATTNGFLKKLFLLKLVVRVSGELK